MNIQRIKDLLEMNEKEIHSYVRLTLERYYEKVIVTKDYIFAEGEDSICLVAHLDTVLKQPPKKVFYDPKEMVLFGSYGLGADDRAGVAAILATLDDGYKPSVIFTLGEEKGGLGAWQLVQDYHQCPFKNVNYFCEIDRHGANNYVTYDCDNPEFDKYIQSFGWEKQEGIFSDIDILCPAWGIAGCNIAAAYINEHTLAEQLYLKQWGQIVYKVEKMIADSASTRQYPYIPAATVSRTVDFYGCAVCDKAQSAEDIFYVRFGKKEANTYVPMCKDCLVELNIQYCPQCKELHWSEDGEKLCDDCKEGLNARD